MEKLRYSQYFNPDYGTWWLEFKLVKHWFSEDEWVQTRWLSEESFKQIENKNNCIVEYYKNFTPGTCEVFGKQDPNINKNFYILKQI